MALKFLILFFLFSFHSDADDCAPVNLITEADSPFAKIPVYNQGSLNICYAYSAAQILDWYQIKNGAMKRNIHPAWAALQYALGRKRQRLEIGHPKETMESIRSALNCDYEAVEAALKSVRNPDDVATLNEALQKHCPLSGRTFVMVPEVGRLNYRTLNEDQAYEKFLGHKLSTSPSPVSIAYCANVWKTPDFDGMEVNLVGQRDVVKKNCHYHESLVVGQKRLGDSCHYLVRNTWGSNWTAHNRNYSCVCRDRFTGAFSDDCRPDTHGNEKFTVEGCWIRGNDLARNIGQVTFIK